MTRTLTDAELADRVRTTLVAVADAVPGERTTGRSGPLVPPGLSPRRRRAVAAGGGLAALALVAFANLPMGGEYVQELPPPDAIGEGEVEGVRFWLVPSFHSDPCGEPMGGVELVSGAANKVGMEWRTGAMAYGDHIETGSGCSRLEQERWLRDPSRAAFDWMRLGADDDGPWGGMFAVHPQASRIVVQSRGLPTRTVDAQPRRDAPQGPRYAAVGLPEDAGVVTITALDAAGRELATETTDLSQLRTPPKMR